MHPRYKTKYRVGNWPAYDRSLVQRGDVTLWLTPEAIATWEAVGVGKRGGHCQVDVERTGSAADGARMQPSDSDTRHLPPDPKGSRAQQAMVDGSQEVTTDTKQIQHDAVH